jgi:hypothetical protein
MRERAAAVPGHEDRQQAAIARPGALGEACLEFATQETGLFETAFAVPGFRQSATVPLASPTVSGCPSGPIVRTVQGPGRRDELVPGGSQSPAVASWQSQA